MSEATAKEEKARKAWRAMLVPMVGSAAVLVTMVVNVLNTHKKHGWPKRAFKASDYFLMSIPLVILAMTIEEEVNGDEA